MKPGVPTINIEGWIVHPEPTPEGKWSASGAVYSFEGLTLDELRTTIWKALLRANQQRVTAGPAPARAVVVSR